MAIINEEKIFIRGVRSSAMKIMQSALKMYERTGDVKFLDHAKYFGDFSNKLKARL